MLTPQEVQDRKFEKAVFGGYDMSGVDEFLEQLTSDYGALYKDNAVLKSKLKVLVETVEEYRSVDEAMRRTLFTAQRMADDLTREAKAKHDEIISRANYEASETQRRLRAENDMELARHKMLREQTEHFTKRLAEAYAKQMEAIGAIKSQVFPSHSPARADPAAQAAREISASVQAELSRDLPDMAAEVDPPPPPPIPIPPPPSPSPSPPPPIPIPTYESLTQPLEPPPAPASQAHEPQSSFEITLKGSGDNQFESDDLEDTLASRPKFEFPDLQSQFGQQYSTQSSKSK